MAKLIRVLGFIAIVCAADGGKTAVRAEERCEGTAAFVRVDTRKHRLQLCEGGNAVASYAVSLGSGGTGKRKHGDKRTPLGRYPIAAPRASRDFLVFIHVGYPTAVQREQGFTGSAIGIHGPPREIAQLGIGIPSAVLAMDWTLGCIAVGSDAEIESIAAWMRSAKPREVVIE